MWKTVQKPGKQRKENVEKIVERSDGFEQVKKHEKLCTELNGNFCTALRKLWKNLSVVQGIDV